MDPIPPTTRVSSGGDRIERTPSISVPLLVWMLAQVGALALSALRVPLWAHAPATGEFLAMDMLLVVQVLAAAILMPRLLASWRSTIVAAASAWPFLILAGLLAALPGWAIMRSGAYLMAWLIASRLMLLPLSSTAAQMRLCALISSWSAGGAILLYCRTELAENAGNLRAFHYIFEGPAIGALQWGPAIGAHPIWCWLPVITAFLAAAMGILRTRVKIGNISGWARSRSHRDA